MDQVACSVIYLDRRAEGHDAAGVRKQSHLDSPQDIHGTVNGYSEPQQSEAAEVDTNLLALRSIFTNVHVCSTGTSCLQLLGELRSSDSDDSPTIILVHIPHDEDRRLRRPSRDGRTPSPARRKRLGFDLAQTDLSDLYGMHFLQHISTEITQKTLSRLVVPIAMLSGLDKPASAPSSPTSASLPYSVDAIRTMRYVDAGAADVLASPITVESANTMVVHAYKTYRELIREKQSFMSERQNRKLSWVGVDDVRPFAYLREAMVSGLMNGICNPESIGETIDVTGIDISPARRQRVAKAVGSWSFSAHDLADDELVLGALVMLEHALQMPELAQWKKTTNELLNFLVASRNAYNAFVLYHNFRHVIDVLQAIFYFLVQIGSLPAFEPGDRPARDRPSPIAHLLKPSDALTLLISAIGHDVGHPGVNNAFLVALNSPLAQLYNDRSVLESFHCAAYSQILRRYWPEAFRDVAMRKLMINIILATDMGLHFKYMSDLSCLQKQLANNNNVVAGWSPKTLDEHKELACGLLIKCADISNVARKFDVAAEWANILKDEFSNQGNMEKELGIPTTLFGGPPERDNLVALGESQIGFMNIFAQPLFESVTQVIPAMSFAVDEINNNKAVWQSKIEVEKRRRTGPGCSGQLEVDTDAAQTGTSRRSASGATSIDPSRSIANTESTATASSNTPTPAPDAEPASPLSLSSSRPSSSSVNSPAVPFHPAAMSSRTQSDITSRRSSSGATSFPVSRRCDPSDEERPDSSAVDVDLSPFVNVQHDSLVHTARTSSEFATASLSTKATPPPTSESGLDRPFSSPSSTSQDSPDITEFAKRFSFKHQDLADSLALAPNGYTLSEVAITSPHGAPRIFNMSRQERGGLPIPPQISTSPRVAATTTPSRPFTTANSTQAAMDRRKHSHRLPFGGLTRSKQDRNVLRHVSSSSALPSEYANPQSDRETTPQNRYRHRTDGDETQTMAQVKSARRNSTFNTPEKSDDTPRAVSGMTPSKFGLKFWRRRRKDAREQGERTEDVNGPVNGEGVIDSVGSPRRL